MKMSKFASAGAAIFLGASLLTGCATAAESTGTAQAVSDNSSSAQWKKAFQGLPGFNGDMIFFKSNRELAEHSDAVVMGAVGLIRDGAQYGNFDDGFPDIKSVVFELKVDKVVQGELRPGEAVYFRMPVPVGLNAAMWQEAIPVGTPMVAYLSVLKSSSAGVEPGFQVKNPGEGIPVNAKVVSAFPQGFALQVAPGQLYWPFSEVSHQGTLEDVLPDGPAHGSPVSMITETDSPK